MKFRFFLAGASAATVASFAAVTACSGTDTPAPTTTNGGASVPAATGAATMSNTRQVFAARKVFLGDTDRNGTKLNEAWRKFGYDLDDKRTSQKSKDVCFPTVGGPAIVDGDNGIDNAFGQKILGLLTTAGIQDPTALTQASIDAGDFTLMFDMTGLSDDPKQTNVALKGQVLVPGPFDTSAGTSDAGKVTPNWADPANVEFRVRSNLVEQNDPSKSLIKFTEVYVNNGLVIAKSPSIDISLAIAGQTVTLSIINAVVTANHATPTTLVGGTIAGILDIARLKKVFGDVGSKLSDKLCPNTDEGRGNLKLIDQVFNGAGDIMVSGPNLPGECTGISIALGFDAVQVKAPTRVYMPSTSEPVKDFCAVPTDAGVKDAAASTDAR